MMEYIFRGPTYRPFPYERRLAEHELEALTGSEADWRGEALTLSVRKPLAADLLRRLAFTSCVEAPSGSIPTQAHLLEQSALHLRNGNGARSLSDDGSSRKESTYLTHGLHRYKGKFYPQLCRSLINIASISPGDLVLDPFVGSGTTLVECAISRIDSIGFDLNPLANLIAATKVDLLQARTENLAAALRRFEAALAEECQDVGLAWVGPWWSEPEGDRGFPASVLAKECGLPQAGAEIQRWFPAAVCQKLVAILRATRRIEMPVFRRLTQVCLSDQIRSVSQQEPRDLRIRRRAQEIEDAPLLSLLSEKLVKEMDKLKAGMAVLGAPVKVGVASAELRDARTLDRDAHPILYRRRVDAVVTSPPYANALPYIDTDRLSLLVLGLLSARERNQLQKEIIGNREIQDRERRALEEEIEGERGIGTFPAAVAGQIRKVISQNRRHPVGFRRRNVPALLYQYFRDMRTVMDKLHAVVRPRGKAFLVLGDSTTQLGNGEELTIRTTEHLAALSEQVGWCVADVWPITVTIEDFAHVRNAITKNKILVLNRGPAPKYAG
ncbi:MAG: TRM11 family SAM-dependent methyltransferase [Chromatiales bacterium]